MIEMEPRGILALVLALLGATLVAFVLYRRTSPTLPPRQRVLLGILRWLATFLVLVLVMDPGLRLARTKSAPPVVCVLVDDSRSMVYPDPASKLDRARSVLSDAFLESLSRKAEVRFFTFSDTSGQATPEQIRNLAARGSRTDLVHGITTALGALDAKPSALVLLSDGGENFGEDALHFSSALKIPVYAISAARSEPTHDVSIDRVETGETVYAGSEMGLAIYVSGRHPSPVETRLAIRDSTGEVFSTRVTIAGGGARQRIAATLPAGDVGIHGFEAVLAPFGGEKVLSNNSMDFSVKVIKGKIRVTLVAPHPSWDFAFARRNLEADSNVDLSVVFRPGSAMAIKSPIVTNDLKRAIADRDVVVVLRGAVLGPEARDLEQFVWKGGAVLVISPDRSGDIVEAVNPFVISPQPLSRQGPPRLYGPVVAEAGVDHEIMDIEAARGGRLWASLPPIPVDGSILGVKKEASLLLSGRPGSREGESAGGDVPLLSVMRYGMGRVVGIAGYDLWRWDLVPKGFGVDVSVFSELTTSCIRWLAQSEETKRLALATSKNDYLWGEPIALLGRVTDENLRALAHATVETHIYDRSSGKMILASPMAEKSAGNHSQVLDLLPPAAYMVKGTARLDGQVYADATIYFTVARRGLEDSGFDGDAALLDEIARATGGRVYSIEEAGSLPGDLSLGRVIVKSYKDVRFRLTLASFIVLVGLLAAEWFLRRRKMLA